MLTCIVFLSTAAICPHIFQLLFSRYLVHIGSSNQDFVVLRLIYTLDLVTRTWIILDMDPYHTPPPLRRAASTVTYMVSDAEGT